MDEKFQDRIDDYLLNRMNDVEKTMFLNEIEQDAEKKEQLEFTRNVKISICSREEKLRTLIQFQQQYKEERKMAAMRMTGTDAACYCPVPNVDEKPVRSKKKIWLWVSSVVAVLVVGLFAIKPMFDYEASPNFNAEPMEQMRGDDDVFTPADSIDNDTSRVNIEKEITPDE